MSPVSSKRTRTGLFLPLTVGAVGALALAFGYIGLHEAIHSSTTYGHNPADLFYYDAQLFVLSSPPVDGGLPHYPLLLNIARFAAPSITLYALIEAGRRVFAAERALMRTRRSRHHDIVCGDTPIADALAARLVEEGARVVRIGSTAPPNDTPSVIGDPTSAAVLRNAGVERARVVYACTADTATNMAIAIAVTAATERQGADLAVHVQVDDPELCIALQARRLGLPSTPGMQINFFSAHEMAARSLLLLQPPPMESGRAAHFMIVGASPFGMALAVELARLWRLVSPGRRFDLVVVDLTATAETERLHRRYPFLSEVCRVTAHDVNVETLLDGDLPEQPPDRVYLCGEDEAVALKIALTMDHFWRRGPGSVVVRLSQLGLLGQAFVAGGDERMLDDVSGTLFLFDAVRAGSDPSLVEDSLVERLGRAIHETYLLGQLRAGVAWGSGRAMRHWTDLSDDVRESNRSQAADIGRKLAGIGCVLAPSPVWGEPAVLTGTTIEHLAEMEHERWLAQLVSRGWRYAPVLDEAARCHPDLLAWPTISEAAKDRNRRSVREMPEFLADVGFQIVRVPDLVS